MVWSINVVLQLSQASQTILFLQIITKIIFIFSKREIYMTLWRNMCSFFLWLPENCNLSPFDKLNKNVSNAFIYCRLGWPGWQWLPVASGLMVTTSNTSTHTTQTLRHLCSLPDLVIRAPTALHAMSLRLSVTICPSALWEAEDGKRLPVSSCPTVTGCTSHRLVSGVQLLRMKLVRSLLIAILHLSSQVNRVTAEAKRKIVQIPGDLVLGGLFPMHEQVD